MFSSIHAAETSWSIAETDKIHAWEKCGVCRFGLFIVVRYVLGKRVNFKHFLVRPQDGKTCEKFCLVLVDNVLWHNPMRIFLRPCWSHCLPVLLNLWKHQTFWLNHCGVWRSWVVRYIGWNCVSAGMMWVWQRRCWNMFQQNSGNICLYHGAVPRSWLCTLFNMLPKKMRPKQVGDFRPIANIRLFYKVFACLVLDGIEHQFDDHQPEEQHGFRRGKRIEEHLLTANVFLDKALNVGIPVWVVSLDLWKAFDRVHWPALWKGLHEQGISEHMIWMISKLYDGQFGEVIGSTGRSRKFSITGGVRQGCVLSPRLFCAVLQFAMRKWRMKVGDLGFDLSDGMPHFIDLRFADGILLFARSAMEVRKLLDSLVAELSEVGLLLNADKTVIWQVKADRLQQSRLTMELHWRICQAMSRRNGWVAC